MYGDHYGISNTRNPQLAELIGKNPETWNEYDNAMLQRVPFMVHIPGMNQGFISETYGGQVDALPTLLHLLGIDTSDYIQLGQDLLSEANAGLVTLRTSGHFITADYTSYGGKTFYTQTGEQITNPDETTQANLTELKEAAKLQLRMSDKVQTGDLLRFYQGNDLEKIDATSYNYSNALDKLMALEKSLGEASTSLFSQRGETTSHLFQAPSYLMLSAAKDEETNQDDKKENTDAENDSVDAETSSETDDN
jgi:lipoteichoic acid synthase